MAAHCHIADHQIADFVTLCVLSLPASAATMAADLLVINFGRAAGPRLSAEGLRWLLEAAAKPRARHEREPIMAAVQLLGMRECSIAIDMPSICRAKTLADLWRAELLLNAALAGYHELYGPWHPKTIEALEQLLYFLEAEGDSPAKTAHSENIARDLVEALRFVHGRAHERSAAAEQRLVSILW